MKKVFSLLLSLVCIVVSYAQQDTLIKDDIESLFLTEKYSRNSLRLTEVEIGKLTRYNSYLSPLLYEGVDFGFFYEYVRLKPNRKINIVVSSHTRLSNMTTTLGGGGLFHQTEKLSFSVLSKLKLTESFNLSLGGGFSLNEGIDYSRMNNNNILFLDLGIDFLRLTVNPELNIQTKKRTIALVDNFNISLIKTSFSTHYTQTLYEVVYPNIYLPNNIHTSLFNYVDFSNRFTVKIPLKRQILTLSHVFEREKISFFSIERRKFVNSLAIGFKFSVYKQPMGRIDL